MASDLLYFISASVIDCHKKGETSSNTSLLLVQASDY